MPLLALLAIQLLGYPRVASSVFTRCSRALMAKGWKPGPGTKEYREMGFVYVRYRGADPKVSLGGRFERSVYSVVWAKGSVLFPGDDRPAIRIAFVSNHNPNTLELRLNQSGIRTVWRLSKAESMYYTLDLASPAAKPAPRVIPQTVTGYVPGPPGVWWARKLPGSAVEEARRNLGTGRTMSVGLR